VVVASGGFWVSGGGVCWVCGGAGGGSGGTSVDFLEQPTPVRDTARTIVIAMPRGKERFMRGLPSSWSEVQIQGRFRTGWTRRPGRRESLEIAGGELPWRTVVEIRHVQREISIAV